MEKVVNIGAKTSLQLYLGIRKIDVRYLKGYKLAKKNKINQNYQDRNKNKSTQNLTPTNNTSQFQA